MSGGRRRTASPQAVLFSRRSALPRDIIYERGDRVYCLLLEVFRYDRRKLRSEMTVSSFSNTKLIQVNPDGFSAVVGQTSS